MRLTGTIECFVSGADIGAGTDWNDEIRQALFRSHLLLLLFTNPSSNWDWCLYEAGLYTRFQEDHVCSVVSMFDPERSAPRPLSNLQGVPATQEKVETFLTRLCRETWRLFDDWLRGPLARQVKSAQITAAAHQIAEAFPTEQPAGTVYHPVIESCSISAAPVRQKRASPRTHGWSRVTGQPRPTRCRCSVPPPARGPRPGAISSPPSAARTPGWRHQLDERYAAALREELFSPTTATLRAFDPEQRQRRYYRPMLFQVTCPPPCVGDGAGRRVQQVTVVFDPQLPLPRGRPDLQPGAHQRPVRHRGVRGLLWNVAHRQRSGPSVFHEIQGAFGLIYEEAEEFGLFYVTEFEQVSRSHYGSSGVHALGQAWDALREGLDAALAARDARTVEQLLGEMRELNRRFSLLATQRYLATLDAHDDESVHAG